MCHSICSHSLPWEAETTEEEEKQMRPIVEEFQFTSPILQITDEQGKHSYSIPDSHPYRLTSTKCHINTVVSPDDVHIVA